MAWIINKDPKYREGKKIKISAKMKKEWETKQENWKYYSVKRDNNMMREKILAILDKHIGDVCWANSEGNFVINESNGAISKLKIADELMAECTKAFQEAINLTTDICSKFWLEKLNEGGEE